MKKNLIKFLIFILLIGGLFVVTGCNDGANQFDDPDNPFEDPEDPQIIYALTCYTTTDDSVV